MCSKCVYSIDLPTKLVVSGTILNNILALKKLRFLTFKQVYHLFCSLIVDNDSNKNSQQRYMLLIPIIQFLIIFSQKSYTQNVYFVFPLQTHKMFKINKILIFNIFQINPAAVINYSSTQNKRVFLEKFEIRTLCKSDTSCSVIM